MLRFSRSSSRQPGPRRLLPSSRALILAGAAKIEAGLEPLAEQAREQGRHAPVIDDEIVEPAGERARGLGYEVEY